MNKKKHLIKDYKKRLEYKNKEILRLKYLMIKNNNILPLNLRLLANNKLALDSKTGERSKIRNRCILTGRSRGIIKEWQISRIKFKLLADQGLIPGIRRASW
jgi:ribosomal protein S14